MKRCIIITTIHEPNSFILHYSQIPGWDLIIVGDSKTDDVLYRTLKCVYLGLDEQKTMFPTLFDKIPLRSYTRKMFGYLYAIQNGYTTIYETDDDNKYTRNLDLFDTSDRPIRSVTGSGFVNVYKLYTSSHIWPRGIPPTHQSVNETPNTTESPQRYVVIQGLVDNDPDVDAIFRMEVNSGSFFFDTDTPYDVVLEKNAVCPFNTQNTFWIDPTMFYALYLPVTVTFRYTDILRGFVALFQMWKHDKTIKFTAPTAEQLRNEHDIRKDYESELTMYQTAEQVISLLGENKDATIHDMYTVLARHGIVTDEELDVLNEWMRLVNLAQNP
jgi:hypothetical protein